jgi:cardiolipin synthase
MEQKTFKKENIPNYISVFRIILIPFYILFFFGVLGNGEKNCSLFLSGCIFVIAGFSDAVDGYLARKNHWITDIGKLLDPLADKMLEVAVTICLAIAFKGPFIILSAIIIVKEIIMVIGAYLIMKKAKVYVSAVWCGKLATIVWYLLICVVHFFPEATEGDLVLCNVLCIVLILVMLMAFAIYVFNYAVQIQSAKDVIIQNKKNRRD